MSFIVLLCQILTQVLRYVPHCCFFVSQVHGGIPDPDPGVEVFRSLVFLVFFLPLPQVHGGVPDPDPGVELCPRPGGRLAHGG